jgi:hypothetical protein
MVAYRKTGTWSAGVWDSKKTDVFSYFTGTPSRHYSSSPACYRLLAPVLKFDKNWRYLFFNHKMHPPVFSMGCFSLAFIDGALFAEADGDKPLPVDALSDQKRLYST